jgi:xanthine dehydrogenase YagR molybdenum-binding subunit
MMFQSVGHRPRTQQRVRLGATPAGKLSRSSDYVNHHAILDNYHEDCGEATAFNTACRTSGWRLAARAERRRRRPCAAPRLPGLYATESAMNELADQLKIDPVRLRVLNEPKIDESLGIPFSSRHRSSAHARRGEVRWSRRTRKSAR